MMKTHLRRLELFPPECGARDDPGVALALGVGQGKLLLHLWSGSTHRRVSRGVG